MTSLTDLINAWTAKQGHRVELYSVHLPTMRAEHRFRVVLLDRDITIAMHESSSSFNDAMRVAMESIGG